MGEVQDYPPYLDYPKPRKPQTNADRIRAMSDEELAWLIAEQRCLYSDHAIDAEYPRVLDWLKAQVEPGEGNDGKTN